jgi:hypothetical protein
MVSSQAITQRRGGKEAIMAKFRIKVHVEFVECNDPINQEPTKNNDGSFS